MKKLSDYQGEDAIELWADLLEPLSNILTNPKIVATVKSGEKPLIIAKDILSECKKDALQIMLRIDPTPIDGFNIIVRLVELINEVGKREDIKSFFGYAEQAKADSEPSGSAMESTEVAEN